VRLTNPGYYDDIPFLREAYTEGKNITELLRKLKGVDHNTPEIIEVAYDLQAGSYIKAVLQNMDFAEAYAGELAELINQHIEAPRTILDIGTGEITTLSLVVSKLAVQPEYLYAFDISWSRIFKGLNFSRQFMTEETYKNFKPFVADIAEIPLLDKSVDITISSHALEPNGDCLPVLLTELFRVTREKLILFEPCYEENSVSGQQRMDRLGYIKGLDELIGKLGGVLLGKEPIKNIANPLNPTFGYVVEPPKVHESNHQRGNKEIFSLPGKNSKLIEHGNFYYSSDAGLCFPVLESIPVLKSKAAILATALIE